MMIAKQKNLFYFKKHKCWRKTRRRLFEKHSIPVDAITESNIYQTIMPFIYIYILFRFYICISKIKDLFFVYTCIFASVRNLYLIHFFCLENYKTPIVFYNPRSSIFFTYCIITINCVIILFSTIVFTRLSLSYQLKFTI